MSTAPPLPFDVKAIAAYSARNGNELSLEVGRVYTVYATDGRGVWWQSKGDQNQVGWFPASYTQVVETPAAAPAPVVEQPPPTPHPQAAQHQQPAVAATPAVVSQPQVAAAQPQPASNGVHHAQPAAAVSSSERNPSKTNVDPALRSAPPIKDPCTVTVHLVESSHTTLPNGKTPNFFIYKRSIFNQEKDLKKLKPLFSLPYKSKTGPFKWNEAFQIYIKDAETEVVCLKFCAKNDFKSKGKDVVGELEFPLRGAVRKFDKPNGIFQSFPLKVGTDKVGEALIFIEYCDPRPFSGPSDVQHKGHVGLNNTGGFEIRDIPQEWKQLFRILNIKKKDLENNAQMAQEVFDIMQKAATDGVNLFAAAEEAGTSNHQEAQEEAYNHAPAGPSTTDATPVYQNNHQAPPLPQHHQPTPAVTPQQNVAAPAPPPPPVHVAATAKPAPPPPAPVQQNSGPKPPPPPGPTSSKPAGGGMSLLEQIQRGTTLKPAQVKQVQAGTASTGNPLADTLLSAMSKYRVDIEGKDNDDADDWD